MRRDEVTFSQKSARWVAGGAFVSLLASLYLLLTPGEVSVVDSVGADGYSRSAIGHRGLVDLLRELDEPVVQLRHSRPLQDCGLLVVAEPHELEGDELRRLAAAVEQAPATLLVLPKRSGWRDPESRHWIAGEAQLGVAEARQPLEALLGEASRSAPEVQREPVPASWRVPADWPEPTFAGPVQLLARRGTRIDAWIECDAGVLLGTIGDLVVLADPDLIANHGLHRGRNAELALAMLRHLNDGGAYVFDERIHGHRRDPSIWDEAGRFPFVLVPVHLLLLLALTLWIAAGRFGVPLPAPPAIAAGKAFLIENIVALLRRGGRAGHAVRRYARQRVRMAAERLHAPTGLGDDACRDFLLRRLRDPARVAELTELLQRPADELGPAEALAVARRIHEITEENPHVES